VNEVIEIIGQLVGNELKVEYKPVVKGDVFQTGGEATRLRSLGWRPAVNIEEGLQAQVDWVRKVMADDGKVL
jgi:nucleoside-diphosphate-sugar epimerase